MSRFVIDNSVVAAWALTEGDAYADRVLGLMTTHRALAPSIWPLEFANVLAVAERRGRLTGLEVARLRDLVLALRISVEVEPPGRILTEILGIARDERLSSYDASYLDLAAREDVPLATLDAELRAAAGRRGVALLAVT